MSGANLADVISNLANGEITVQADDNTQLDQSDQGQGGSQSPEEAAAVEKATADKAAKEKAAKDQIEDPEVAIKEEVTPPKKN